jgi:hypothetical protein
MHACSLCYWDVAIRRTEFLRITIDWVGHFDDKKLLGRLIDSGDGDFL